MLAPVESFYLNKHRSNAKSWKFTKGFNNIMYSNNSLSRDPKINRDLKSNIIK